MTLCIVGSIASRSNAQVPLDPESATQAHSTTTLRLPILLAQASGPQGNVNPASSVTPNGVNSTSDNEEDSGGFLSILFSGGWIGVVIVFALLALSMVAIYLIVDQILTLRRREILPQELASNVRQVLAQGKVKEADQLCRAQPTPLAFILLSGLSEIEYGWASVEKALEESTAEQAARLYRKIEYLSVIGNLAPMVGLLGTVTGMILAFRQVAVSQGAAGAADLAEGIYSALVTTVGGLLIAIPSLGAFAIFRNRVDQLIAETAYMAQNVFAPIRRRLPAQGSRK